MQAWVLCGPSSSFRRGGHPSSSHDLSSWVSSHGGVDRGYVGGSGVPQGGGKGLGLCGMELGGEEQGGEELGGEGPLGQGHNGGTCWGRGMACGEGVVERHKDPNKVMITRCVNSCLLLLICNSMINHDAHLIAQKGGHWSIAHMNFVDLS